MSDSSVKPTTKPEIESKETVEVSSETMDSMEEYYQLKQKLLLATLALTGVICLTVGIFYSLNTALNYLLGAGVGLVYLRLLAREVERLGTNKRRIGYTRIALFAGLIILATQWQQLQILPVFLGFMTYKAAIIFYVLPNSLMATKKEN